MAKSNKFDMSNLNAGHRQRLRDRFLRFGADGLADYELLELLLTFSIPRRDVKPLAKMLLTRFGSLDGVFNAPFEALCEIPGIKEHSASLIKLVDRIHSLPDETKIIKNAVDAVNFARNCYIGREKTFTMLLMIDPGNNLISTDIREGNRENLLIDPHTISKCMINCGAAGMVIIHNEPFCKFTFEPVMAQMLLELLHYLRGLELYLVDDIVLAGNSYFSYLNHLGMDFKNYIDYQLRELPMF